MKQCTKCKETKELNEFNKNKDCYNSWCIKCVRERSKEFYLKNKEKQILKFKKQNKEKADFILSLKEGKYCEKCGYNKCLASLDFHHLDPKQKDFNISDFKRTRGFSDLILINNEIKKCIVLCSNCHREFHFLERQNNINIEKYLKLN